MTSWMFGLVLLTFLCVCCGRTTECDTAPYYRCAGGIVFEGGCGGSDSVVAQCAKGCAVDGMYAGLSACPLALCRENSPKEEGDVCETEDDCFPTQAVASATMISNVNLTCDLTTHRCVATASPTVADWKKPCSAEVVARLASEAGGGGIAGVVPDSGCTEGWCAFASGLNSCIANGCTRLCTGDQDCPSESTCRYAGPPSCRVGLTPYCEPGGPTGIGFSCP
jgi:hypothetical protein